MTKQSFETFEIFEFNSRK